MLTESFQIAREVIEKIERSGYQAYFVGGCVRDLLLEKPVGDIDITTSAKPEEVLEIFGDVIPVGIEHGTVIVRHRKQLFEVTTFRLDGRYTDQRHPDSVEFIDQIDQDLQRRDFTINALAMNKDGLLIDLFDGKKDIQRKLIRTVGNGFDRFTEDPLRIVRALRFSSQLGFSIERETITAIKKVKSQIESIAIERITNELTKLVSGKYIQIGLDYLKATEVYKHLPVMIEYTYIIDKLPKEMKPLASFAEFIAICHFLVPDVPISTWINEWKCSNKTKKEAIQLVEALAYYDKNGLDRWLLYQLNTEFHEGFLTVATILFKNKTPCESHVKQLIQELPIRSKRDLALNGNDLVRIFPLAKKGPWIQNMLNRIEREVVMGRVENTKYSLKEWIKWNPPEIN